MKIPLSTGVEGAVLRLSSAMPCSPQDVPLHPLRRGNQISMLRGAAAGGMGNSCENALKVGGAVLSGDLGRNMISRRAERLPHRDPRSTLVVGASSMNGFFESHPLLS